MLAAGVKQAVHKADQGTVGGGVIDRTSKDKAVSFGTFLQNTVEPILFSEDTGAGFRAFSAGHAAVKRFGTDLDETYGDVIERNKKDGLLTCPVEDRVTLTEKGMDVSNYVMAQFLLE